MNKNPVFFCFFNSHCIGWIFNIYKLFCDSAIPLTVPNRQQIYEEIPCSLPDFDLMQVNKTSLVAKSMNQFERTISIDQA